jgi:hypothetical protein
MTRGKLIAQKIRAEMEMALIRDYHRLFSRLIDKHYNKAFKSYVDAENALYDIDKTGEKQAVTNAEYMFVLAERDAMKADIEQCSKKLHDGTLHEPHCNADHSKEVGCETCSCLLGRRIKHLKAEVSRLLELLRAYDAHAALRPVVKKEASQETKP